MSFSDLDEKYRGVDIKRIDPSLVETEEECCYLTYRLDNLIAEIDADLHYSSLAYTTLGKEVLGIGGVVAARRALAAARATRNAICDRRGQIKREIRLRWRTSREKALLKVLKVHLDEQKLAEIFHDVRANYPGIWATP